MFATGIENSSPTIGRAHEQVDEMTKCSHYKQWSADFDLVRELGIRCLPACPHRTARRRTCLTAASQHSGTQDGVACSAAYSQRNQPKPYRGLDMLPLSDGVIFSTREHRPVAGLGRNAASFIFPTFQRAPQQTLRTERFSFHIFSGLFRPPLSHLRMNDFYLSHKDVFEIHL